MSHIAVIILAAGKGKRMLSESPKALYEIAGKPMLARVIEASSVSDSASHHIVVGYQAQAVMDAFAQHSAQWHQQAKQLGTADAVATALQHIADDDTVLVTYTDMPLIKNEAYQEVIEQVTEQNFVLLTAELADPSGYGRILRAPGNQAVAIVEEADANAEQKRIKEVNVGVVAAKAKVLKDLIQAIDTDNQQKEYYLTDCLNIAVDQGIPVSAIVLNDATQAQGVNTIAQANQAERILLRRAAISVSERAVVKDTDRLDVRGELSFGANVSFDVGVILEGEVSIGDDVVIGPYSLIKDSVISDGTHIKAYSHIEHSKIGKHCNIGPYARLRPETVVADDSSIGNFVEVKKSQIGQRTKINHLSYVGDSEVGSEVNIGAGVITCNYDGANKHKTIIEDNVFIGSDTQIVAPVTIGKGATIGAGSTIAHDADPDALTLSRSEQKTVKGWKRPQKGKDKS